MNLVELSESEYRKFEPKHPFGNIMQEIERKKLREWMGWDCYLLGTKEEKKVTSSCLLLVRNRYAMIQMGPVLDWSDLVFVKKWLKAVCEFCKSKNFISLEIFPYVLMSVRDKHGDKLEEHDVSKLKKIFKELGFEYGGETVEAQAKAMRWMAVKDLTGLKNMDDVWATYKNTVRTQIRKCRTLIKVDTMESKAEMQDVGLMFSESNTRNGVHDRSLSYYSKIYEYFGDKVIFQIARKLDNDEPVAAHMFFVTEHEAVSYAAGISEKYKSLNGMTMLNDAFFEYCLNHGIERCNLYGISGDFSQNNRLLAFKKQFGIKIEEYIGGFTCILDEKAFKADERKQKFLGMLRKVKYGAKRTLNKIRRKH